ncbi:hypothetical protein RCCS2_17706 [Roseobacter sp. CCS2]|nr:hypothetical protein RCCS2_17706 [Roseobacter sp. CCS2]
MFFTKAHGIYVPGDIAGFDPDMAEKLKAVAEKYDPKKHSRKKPNAEVATAEINARTSELDAREAALAEREAALEATAPTDEKTSAQKADKASAPPKRSNT